VEAHKTTGPNYYHKVVDCQWGLSRPYHVPGYIRLIARAVSRTPTCSIASPTSSPHPRTHLRPTVANRPVAETASTEAPWRSVGSSAWRRPQGRHQRPASRHPTTRRQARRVHRRGTSSLTVATMLLPLGYEVSCTSSTTCPAGSCEPTPVVPAPGPVSTKNPVSSTWV